MTAADIVYMQDGKSAARRIRSLCQEAGVSVYTVLDDAGVSHSTYTRWMRLERSPSLATIAKIFDAISRRKVVTACKSTVKKSAKK